jgi:ferrochelatase
MATATRGVGGRGVKRVRVILAAHGEAETAGFAENFRVSHRTLKHAAQVMRLPAPLRLAICFLGALRKRATGAGGSAHNRNTRRQAAALERALDVDGDVRYRAQAAFASSPPYLEDLVGAPGDADQQVLLSMIPTDSRLACGLVCHSLLDAPASVREGTAVLARLWENPDFIALQCEHIAAHFPQTARGRPCCLVLVMHGTVVRDERGDDPGFHTGAIEKDAYGRALISRLMARAHRPWERVEIAYLNHGVGGEWSSPTLPELLARLAAEGVHSAVAYACEHLVDGGETAGLPAVLAASPLPETHQLPSLNAAAPFMDFLAARIRKAVAGSAPAAVCDACPLPR